MSYDKKSCLKKGREKVLVDHNDDVIKAQAAFDKASAALANAEKQEKDEEKKRADEEARFITIFISDTGYMSKCRIPVAVVAQYGLFHVLFGTAVVTEEVVLKQPRA